MLVTCGPLAYLKCDPISFVSSYLCFVSLTHWRLGHVAIDLKYDFKLIIQNSSLNIHHDNCPRVIDAERHRWEVNIGLGNGLAP